MLEALVSDPSIWSSFRSRVVQCDAFCSTPHAGYRKAKMHLLCPVFMLTFYLESIGPIRRKEQLFICFWGLRCWKDNNLTLPLGSTHTHVVLWCQKQCSLGCVSYMHSGIMDKDMSAHTVLMPGHVRLLLRVCVCGDPGLVKVVTGCTGVS